MYPVSQVTDKYQLSLTSRSTLLTNKLIITSLFSEWITVKKKKLVYFCIEHERRPPKMEQSGLMTSVISEKQLQKAELRFISFCIFIQHGSFKIRSLREANVSKHSMYRSKMYWSIPQPFCWFNSNGFYFRLCACGGNSLRQRCWKKAWRQFGSFHSYICLPEPVHLGVHSWTSEPTCDQL